MAFITLYDRLRNASSKKYEGHTKIPTHKRISVDAAWTRSNRPTFRHNRRSLNEGITHISVQFHSGCNVMLAQVGKQVSNIIRKACSVFTDECRTLVADSGN